MPLVSVIVPVHNRTDRLLPTLQGIASQTFRDFQCMVVDDASDDRPQGLPSTVADVLGCLERPYGCVSSSPIFKLIRRDQQGGPAHARNTGIQYALDPCTEWIALCDSDDVWHANKIETQLKKLQHTGGKVCHTNEIWIKNGHPHNPKKKHAKPPDGRIFLHCLPLCCVSVSTVMIHRSVFEDVGLFDGSLWACEDYELWLRIFSAYEAVLCPEYLVTKRGGHPDQVSRQYIGMDRFRLYALLKTLQTRAAFLSSQELAALQRTLVTKASILECGYRKHRGDFDLYTQIRQWVEQGRGQDLPRELLLELTSTFPWKRVGSQG